MDFFFKYLWCGCFSLDFIFRCEKEIRFRWVNYHLINNAGIGFWMMKNFSSKDLYYFRQLNSASLIMK